MKKIITLLICILGIFLLTGCGAGDVGGPGYNPNSGVEDNIENTSQQNQINMDDYEDNIDGLVQYMRDSGCIEGEATSMSASIIGAEVGYRFTFIYEKAGVSVELYEYDINNLSDTAKEVLSSIGETGKFTINKNEVSSTISDNGKYLMIYNCSKENESNDNKKSETEEIFKKFKAQTDTSESAND